LGDHVEPKIGAWVHEEGDGGAVRSSSLGQRRASSCTSDDNERLWRGDGRRGGSDRQSVRKRRAQGLSRDGGRRHRLRRRQHRGRRRQAPRGRGAKLARAGPSLHEGARPDRRRRRRGHGKEAPRCHRDPRGRGTGPPPRRRRARKRRSPPRPRRRSHQESPKRRPRRRWCAPRSTTCVRGWSIPQPTLTRCLAIQR
jgi:hypothetical protein